MDERITDDHTNESGTKTILSMDRAETLRDYRISLTGGNTCNFDERWNPQKLEEILLLLLLGIDIDIICITLVNITI
jgi:hypothetical protein